MDWLRAAFDRVILFLPDLVAGLFIVLIGYVVAIALRRLASGISHRLGFDSLLVRHRLVEGPPEKRAGSRGLGSAVFWVVLVATLLQAARAWQLDAVANGLTRMMAYLPHVIGAGAIFVVALLFADWVERRIRAREGSRTLTAGAVRASILVLGGFLALRELQIAPQIVTLAFGLALGGIALAVAISFGLGGRTLVEELGRDWYEGRSAQEEPTRTPSEARPITSEPSEPSEPPLH